MPKPKTHKGLKRRVKITATGKVKHKRSCGGHLMSSKSGKRRRRVNSSAVMTDAAAKKVRTLL